MIRNGVFNFAKYYYRFLLDVIVAILQLFHWSDNRDHWSSSKLLNKNKQDLAIDKNIIATPKKILELQLLLFLQLPLFLQLLLSCNQQTCIKPKLYLATLLREVVWIIFIHNYAQDAIGRKSVQFHHTNIRRFLMLPLEVESLKPTFSLLNLELLPSPLLEIRESNTFKE